MTEATPKFVRAGRPDDAAFIARIQVRAMGEQLDMVLPGAGLASGLSAPDIEAAWQQTLRQPPAADRGVLVAEDNQVPVGFAAFFGAPPLDDAVIAVKRDDIDQAAELAKGNEIIAFEVDSSRTGQGHGSRLLSAMADLAKGAGQRNLQIWLIAEDVERIRFFQDAGFAPIGVRRTLAAGTESFTQHLWYAAFA